MKQFLLEGKRIFTPCLLSALPGTAKQEIEIDGMMVNNTHPEFKLAVLTRLCNLHWGELRQFGGVWRLAWGAFNPSSWAKRMKPEELTALERRTHPLDMPTWKFQPRIYSEQDLEAQVRQGLRPDPTMKAFLTNTPQVVLEIPVATISDAGEHMILRAICDERISLPMEAFKDYPEVYSKIAAVIPIGDMMDVKVAWRCNTSQYWHCEASSAEAGPIYNKLGYSPQAITAMGLNPYGGPITLTAQGAKLFGEGGAHGPHPTPGAGSGGQHSQEPFCSIEADDGKTYEEARKPPITVHNAVSALGKDYMKKNYPGGGRHAFWGQMECGLVLSSVSPWEMVQKEKGVTRGGYVCKWRRGFWKGKMGSSRFLQITSGRTVLQLVLDEPPERLYNRWVKDRIEFYKRLEPTAPLRDVPLKVDPNPVHRLRFSVSNGLGHVSDAIWSVVFGLENSPWA